MSTATLEQNGYEVISPDDHRNLPSLNGLPSGAMQVKSKYVTAMHVQIPRRLPVVENRLMEEANLAGSSFFYGWGVGKDRIEGPSIDCAMAAVRAYGNCQVEMDDVQETRDAWIFKSSFVDFETGFTVQRQFRQSKNSIVYGRHDDARKEDIRFQIGQSKALRNVILTAVPKWLTSKAVDIAKGGLREKIQKRIESHAKKKNIDIGEAQREIARNAVVALSSHEVSEEQVLLKYGRNTVAALTVEDLVMIMADIEALKTGTDTVDVLYPPPKPEDAASSTQNGKIITGKADSKTDSLAEEMEAALQKASDKQASDAKTTSPVETPSDAPESKPQWSLPSMYWVQQVEETHTRHALENIKTGLSKAKDIPDREREALTQMLELKLAQLGK